MRPSRTYWQLFMARFGVGGSEACLTPAAWSIIADSFPERMIPRAFSIFMMGPYLGGGLALIFGGLLLDSASHWDLSAVPLIGAMKPWQVVFLAAGLPGLLIVALMFFVKEPARHASRIAEDKGQMAMADVWRVFVDHRGFYGNFYAGMSSLSSVSTPSRPGCRRCSSGVSTLRRPRSACNMARWCWLPGRWALAGPWLARMLEKRGKVEALMLLPFCSALGLIVVSIALGFTNSYASALAVATAASFIYSMPQALASSALQLATPNRMRGIASAVYVFVVSVTGVGAAPTIVAMLTDHVFGDEKRVGESLSVTCAGAGPLSAFFLWRALKSHRQLPAAR